MSSPSTRRCSAALRPARWRDDALEQRVDVDGGDEPDGELGVADPGAVVADHRVGTAHVVVGAVGGVGPASACLAACAAGGAPWTLAECWASAPDDERDVELARRRWRPRRG